MESTLVKSQKNMKRTESKKSHSWWWDSHVSPKNSRWLAENLEEMDQSIKRMLKLIEGDGDSFAKKADLYYQKRPELISHVEEFYRMYRSLAERYDHVTGELRKNIPSDLQSQGSGISDNGSDPAPATVQSQSDSKFNRPKTRPRAAGFEFFLGTGGSSSDMCKEGDETSTLDSDIESDNDDDDSSVNNYSQDPSGFNGDDVGSRKRVLELEVEVRDAKEKIHHMQQEDSFIGSPRGSNYENFDNLFTRIRGYEEELRVAKETIRVSNEEISRLKLELNEYKSRGTTTTNDFESQVDESSKEGIEKELKFTKNRLRDSERLVADLQEQLGLAWKENSGWKSKLDKEKREVIKMVDRVTRYKDNLADRHREIRQLKESISNANASLSEDNSNLQAEITKLLKERAYMEDELKELDLRSQSLEEDVRRAQAGKDEMEDLLAVEIKELTREKDELNSKIAELNSEMGGRENQIERMSKHLDQMHVQHMELITGIERANKTISELNYKVDELEREVENKQIVILEGAEEKREAIRQLCFSIEHYRDCYNQLWQVVSGHRLPTLIAS